MVGIHDQSPSNRSLRLRVRMMPLWRQHMLRCNADFAMTPHASVNSGKGSRRSWTVILIKSLAARFFQIVHVLVRSHSNSSNRLIMLPDGLRFRGASAGEMNRTWASNVQSFDATQLCRLVQLPTNNVRPLHRAAKLVIRLRSDYAFLPALRSIPAPFRLWRDKGSSLEQSGTGALEASSYRPLSCARPAAGASRDKCAWKRTPVSAMLTSHNAEPLIGQPLCATPSKARWEEGHPWGQRR
ncbi:hypothetical protein Bra471DRAFT_01802 [Bradyrhizobium sp. WSM471]|nr:hypothetical protein Bra471DRAFT_01802 [Bradyrhizobium sp. WSM471]